MEQFEAVGKTPAEFEKEEKDEILKNKVDSFIDKNKDEIDKIIRKQKQEESNAFDIILLINKFIKEAGCKDFTLAKKLIVGALAEKHELSKGGMVRGNIRGEDGAWVDHYLKHEKKKRLYGNL